MNPIIRRELLAALRSQKSVVLLTLVAIVFSLLVVFRWPAGDQVDLSGALSQQVFRVFGYGLLTTLVLMAPAFPATSIVRERTQGTLLLVLNSPMPVAQIYIGKFFGVSGFVLLVLVVCDVGNLADQWSAGAVWRTAVDRSRVYDTGTPDQFYRQID